MSHTHTPALDPTPAWEKFLDKNFKTLLRLFIVLIIVLGIYGLLQYMKRAEAVKAGEAYTSAKTVEDLDLVIHEHGGSLAAGNALLKKADLLWEQNKKTSSVDALQEFAGKYKHHPLLPHALLALGSKLESIGKSGDAKPVFERIVNEFGKSDVAVLAEVRLGDLLWAAGKEAEAKKIYEGLAAKFPGSDNAILTQGENRTQWIAAKLPTKEVDGPPKPKVDKAAGAPNIPGMPNFNMNGPGGLSPTVSGPDGTSRVINLTPGASTSAPISISSGPAKPAPAASAPVSAATQPVAIPAVPAKPEPAKTAPPVPAAPATAAPAPAAPAPAAPAPAAPAPAAPTPAAPTPAKAP